MIKGLYRHYKGNNYLVIYIAKHTETNEEMVIYKRAEDFDNINIWVRPLSMFNENVTHDNKLVKRFEFISEVNK